MTKNELQMHWVMLVKAKKTPGWESQEEPNQPSYNCGGMAEIDDGRPLPTDRKACRWCGRLRKAVVVACWTARSFRESIWGPGEHYSFDKPYKTPLKWRTVGYPCICSDERRAAHNQPVSHWIVLVALRKSAGWDLAPV